MNLTDMTISMSDTSWHKLSVVIRDFTDMSQTLVHPALQSAYTKISGKQIGHMQLYLNRTVIHNFHWLTDTIKDSDGIHILDAIEWDSSDADLIVYSDASLNGLGFCIPDQLLGFCASTPDECPHPTIFYFRSLMIMLAILWASG